MPDGGAIAWVDHDDTSHSWASQHEWAEAWWRASRKDLTAFSAGHRPEGHPDDPAKSLLMELALQRDPTVVPLVVTLSELAESEDEMSYLGAGAIEDVLCIFPGGERFIDSVEAWAARSPTFRDALSYMWVSDDVSDTLRRRLLALGAIDHRTAAPDE
jgi:hypothetical protein